MSLGKDLASIRKSQNLTLEDIQNAVKIPLDTLKSIENDRIFSDPNKNKTYVRSFVRSYAKVLKIADEDIVEALDQVEEGSYAGSLLREPKTSVKKTSPLSAGDEEDFDSEDETPIQQEPAPKPSMAKPKQQPVPDEDSINWADIGNKFSTSTTKSRIWIVALSLIFILVIGGLGYYFWSGSDTPSVEQQLAEQVPGSANNDQTQTAVPPSPVDSAAIAEEDTQAIEQISPAGFSELGDTLTVAVYAAYGQLEPVRITSDLNWRTNPFWMEEGQAYNFDFQDTLLVRGQYSRMLLLFNGHVIENPRQNYFNNAFNSVMITRDVLNQPRYLAPSPEEFPLEVGAPDSVVYRISF